MSEIKVNSIKGVGASAAAITVNNTDGTCTANITNNLSNRRLNINGDMKVAQRPSAAISSTAYGAVDRYQLEVGGLDEGVTVAQADVASDTTPYTLGFRKSLKLTNGNQSNGAGGTDTMRILHKFEAQDIAQSGWNYRSASSFITLSFWIKSSVAQSFKVAVISWDGTIMTFTFDTGSLTADTWTKVTKTIPGNSNITIDNDNNLGFQISFFQYLGTTYTASGYTEDAWAAFANPQTKDQTTTWYTTNNATYELTGVQLEVGSVATDFEHRSFGDELLKCQRYYFKYLEGTQKEIGAAWYYLSNHASFFFEFPTTMRTAPTGTDTTGGSYYTIYRNGGSDALDSVTFENASTEQFSAYNSSEASGTAGQCGLIRSTNASAKIEFSAEL